jgi:hypothetical protein
LVLEIIDAKPQLVLNVYIFTLQQKEIVKTKLTCLNEYSRPLIATTALYLSYCFLIGTCKHLMTIHIKQKGTTANKQKQTRNKQNNDKNTHKTQNKAKQKSTTM